LSHYRLAEQIGEGGMGVVWRATDTTLDRDVAIKVLPEAFARDPERMARFEREAKILASLNHPHVAAIYGLASDDGVRFLAMELVEGEDLAARLLRGPLPIVESLEIAAQIAEALESAHEKGIVHRDLKPANVKVTADGQVKVLDFGLAKALEGESAAPSGSGVSMTHSPTLTGTMTAGVILGTAAYMSPEQARGKVVDRRADIWAFGCVLYECLTGKRAFVGETVSDTLAKILEREPDFDALPAATPAPVRELLRRCFVKDPKLRLRDIGDARIVIDEVLASRSPSGRLLAVDAAAPGAATAARRAALPIAIAALLGLLVGAAAWRVLGPGGGSGGDDHATRALTVDMPPNVTVFAAILSNDGRSIIVVGQPKPDGSGTEQPTQIYTRRLDSYAYHAIAGTEGVTRFAPDLDSRGVKFVAPVGVGSNQKRAAHVFLEGGAPPTAMFDWKDAWAGFTHLESGDYLTSEAGTAFVRIPKNGGPAAAPVKMDAGRPGVIRYELSLDPLPGDRGIFANVISYDNRGWHYSVGVVDLKTGKVKVVIEDGGNAVYSPNGYMLFARGEVILATQFDLARLEVRGNPVAVWYGVSTPFPFVPGFYFLRGQGTLFYLPGEVGGSRQLALLEPAGELHPWSPELRPVDNSPEPSPDGRRFVASLANARGIDELWISDLARPGFRRLGTDPNADCFGPRWTPDGKRIVYRRRGGDDRDGLYMQDVEGGTARRILKNENASTLYIADSWLPDGSALILGREVASKRGLFVLPYSEDESDSTKLRRFLPTAFNQFDARLSPDGRLLAYISDESGKTMTNIVELRADGSTGRPVEVAATGSRGHLWSADGKTLFVEDERNRVMKVAVTRTPELAVSVPTPLFDLQKLGVAMWSVLPDGRFFVGMKSSDETDITRYNLVLNWDAELKRKMRSVASGSERR
jgi:serine/threonine-protein kinase